MAGYFCAWSIDDLETPTALTVALTLTATGRGTKPTTRQALQAADRQWHVNGIELTEPGIWTATVDTILRSNRIWNLLPRF